jgi:hypothetical protein
MIPDISPAVKPVAYLPGQNRIFESFSEQLGLPAIFHKIPGYQDIVKAGYGGIVSIIMFCKQYIFWLFSLLG